MSMEWLKRITESKEERKKRQLEELAQTDDFKELIQDKASEILREHRDKEQQRIEEERKNHKEKVNEAKENLETLGNEMKNSPEPFVNVLSIGFNAENGIEVKLDYNQAFIRYLHAAGIKGKNEEETIRMWLAHLNYDIGQDDLAQDYVMNGVDGDEMPSMSFEEIQQRIVDDDGEDEDEPHTGW